jgi:hypothetical protein
MNTLHTVLTAAPAAAAPMTRKPRAAETMKNVALFFAAPFVALAYVILFPFVGLAMLAWIGARAAVERRALRAIGRTAAKAGLFVAAPLLALAYVVLFPFVGLAALAWIGARALLAGGEAEAVAELPTAAAA